VIASPKLLKRIGMMLEHGQNVINGGTASQISSEWLIQKVFSSLLIVLAQGGIKD